MLTAEVRPDRLAQLIVEDRTAEFGRLWTSSRRALFGSVRRRAGSLGAAEDIVSATYVRALAAWPRYADRGVGGGWLLAIARNLLVDRARSSYSRHTVLSAELPDAPAPGVDPAEWAVSSHQAVQVRRALADIPTRQAECVTWRYLADRSVVETAQVMRCSPATVKTLQRCGLNNLRAHPLIHALRGS